MLEGLDRRDRVGISSRRAPWRRAARPLCILFSLQLSGIGCAARPATIPPPTHPYELEPYLAVYEDQLEGEGITVAEAERYLSGRSSSPLADADRADDISGNGVGNANGAAAVDTTDVAFVDGETGTGQPGEPTYKMVDGVAEYRIGPGDVLQLTTFLGPEAPAEISLRVQSDGTVNITRFNIGSVAAAGYTPTELTRTITDAYRRFVPSAFGQVRIDEYNAWRATLSGEILNRVNGGTGSYALDGRVTVSQFVYKYGGPTANADLGDVRILRQGAQQHIDVGSILSGLADDPTLRSGDIVRVPAIQEGSSRMFIFGEVARPGVYTYTEGISVLDAIAQAGGYTQTAQRDAVYVSRPSTEEVIPVNLDITLGAGLAASAPQLEPGDFVVVPYSPDRSQKIRDWVGIASLILSALTILELIRRD